MARSKVKSRSHHDITRPQPQTNVPTKYQLPTPYGFRDIAGKNFIRQGHHSKVKSRSYHEVAHLQVPPNTFSRRPPAHPDTMGGNNTLTALKDCGAKRYGLMTIFCVKHC